MRIHTTNLMATLGAALLGTGLCADAAEIPVHAEVKVNTLQDSGQSGAALSNSYTQYNGPDAPAAQAFGSASVDVNRPAGLIRMRATMDRENNPGYWNRLNSLSGRAEAYFNDQIILPAAGGSAPQTLSLTVGLDAVVSGAPDGSEGSRAWTQTQISAFTPGDSGAFNRIDGSTPNADMQSLLSAPEFSAAPAYVTINPGASSGTEVLLSGGDYSVPWDSYTGPMSVPETFSGVSYDASITLDIPLEKIEAGQAYYPFQLRVQTQAGVAGGGTSEADMGQSVTLDALTLPDGTTPANFSFDSGATLVPEPSTGLAMMYATLAVMARRRRRPAAQHAGR